MQDPELQLYDWLKAVIAGMAEEDMLFARYHVDLHDAGLAGTALGETVDVEEAPGAYKDGSRASSSWQKTPGSRAAWRVSNP